MYFIELPSAYQRLICFADWPSDGITVENVIHYYNTTQGYNKTGKNKLISTSFSVSISER